MIRRTPLIVAGVVSIALGTTVYFPPVPRLIWNASTSVPIGLYRLNPVKQLTRGDLVAVQTPPAFALLFAKRGYLPIRVPLLKYVAALGGQSVCRMGVRITIDGRTVSRARHFDTRGRALPAWHGCHRLTQDQLFLLNPKIRDSLDGRYFGAVARQSVLGRVVPIWLVGPRGAFIPSSKPSAFPHQRQQP